MVQFKKKYYKKLLLKFRPRTWPSSTFISEAVAIMTSQRSSSSSKASKRCFAHICSLRTRRQQYRTKVRRLSIAACFAKRRFLAWHQIAETSSDISKMTVSTVICSLRGLKVKYLYLKLIVNLSIYP